LGGGTHFSSNPATNNETTITAGHQQHNDTPGNTDTSGIDSNNAMQHISERVISCLHSAVEQKVHVELLHMLQVAEAPDYLFQQIIQWGNKAHSLQYDFQPRQSTKKSAIKALTKYFHSHAPLVKPSNINTTFENISTPVPVIKFEFLAQLQALLNDPTIMNIDNLIVNHSTNNNNSQEEDHNMLFQPYQPKTAIQQNQQHEILASRWYQNTVAKYQHDKDAFILPLILYCDKTFIDPFRSNFNLEPVNFTLAIFNQACRMEFKFWQTLGYIPDSICSTLQPRPDFGYKMRNIHTALNVILQDIASIHQHPHLLDGFLLTIGSYQKKSILKSHWHLLLQILKVLINFVVVIWYTTYQFQEFTELVIANL
jgi:hypothetical protein